MAFRFVCSQGCKSEDPGRCPEHLEPLEEASFGCPSCEYAALEPGNCPFCRVSLRSGAGSEAPGSVAAA